jgi:hypothetical protein
VGACLTAVLAVAGVAASQAAYRRAGLTLPLVITTLVNPLVASLIGVAVLDDGFHHGVAGHALVVTAAGAAALGLLLLVRDRAGGEGTTTVNDRVPSPWPSDRHASLPGQSGNHAACPSDRATALGRTRNGPIPDASGGQSCRNSPYVSQ